MKAPSFLVAAFFPFGVSGTPGCSCAVSSCCSNGVPDASLNPPNPYCMISNQLYRDQVISNDTLCNVSDDRGICDVIANDKAFIDQYESDKIWYTTLGSGLRVAREVWYGPVTLLQEGSCEDLPDSGCGVFEDRLSTSWSKTDVGTCAIFKKSFPEKLSLDVSQRCASWVSDLGVQDVQDQLEISVEWNNTYTGDLCDIKEARFKVDRSQWKQGPQGAQYVCLDVPKQGPISTTVNALRVVVLNVGNLPCEGIINPSADPPINPAMTTQLSLLTASMLLLLRNLQ